MPRWVYNDWIAMAKAIGKEVAVAQRMSRFLRVLSREEVRDLLAYLQGLG